MTVGNISEGSTQKYIYPLRQYSRVEVSEMSQRYRCPFCDSPKAYHSLSGRWHCNACGAEFDHPADAKKGIFR